MRLLTSVSQEDLSGDPGIMVDLLALNISMKRIVEFVNPTSSRNGSVCQRGSRSSSGTTITRNVKGHNWEIRPWSRLSGGVYRTG